MLLRVHQLKQLTTKSSIHDRFRRKLEKRVADIRQDVQAMLRIAVGSSIELEELRRKHAEVLQDKYSRSLS
jgi:hypothetical protein